MHREPFTKKCTHENLHRSLYTQAFLHANALPPGKNTDSACTSQIFSTHKMRSLHLEISTQKWYHTENVLNINVFTNSLFHTTNSTVHKETCLHKQIFTCRNFDTKVSLQRDSFKHTHIRVYEQKPLHTEICTERRVLHTKKNTRKKNAYIFLHRNIWTSRIF